MIILPGNKIAVKETHLCKNTKKRHRQHKNTAAAEFTRRRRRHCYSPASAHRRTADGGFLRKASRYVLFMSTRYHQSMKQGMARARGKPCIIGAGVYLLSNNIYRCAVFYAGRCGSLRNAFYHNFVCRQLIKGAGLLI